MTDKEIIVKLNTKIVLMMVGLAVGDQPDVIDITMDMLRINRKPYRCRKATRELIRFVEDHMEYWQTVYENGNECKLYYLGDRVFAISYEPPEAAKPTKH